MLTNKNIFFFNNGQGSSNAASQYYYGVDALTDSNYYQTEVTNSLNGVSGSGLFHVQALIRVDTATPVPSSEGIFISNIIFTPSVGGWQLSVNSSRQIQFACYNAAGSDIRAVASAVTEGETVHVCAVHDGTFLKVYKNGVLAVSQSIVGYRTPAYVGSISRTMIGKRVQGGGLGPFGNVTVFGAAGGDYVPTADEVYQAYLDSVRQADIVTIPGKTNHLWSVKQNQNGSAPSTLVDAVGSSSMTSQGVPVLGITAPNSMTTYGLDDLNDSNYYWSAVSGAIDGITGSGNFWVTCMFSVDSQAVTSQNRYMLNHGIANTSGWYMRTLGQNGTLSFAIHDNNAVARTAPSYTIQATDVNKVIVATGYHSVTGVHLNVNGADVGSNTITNGYRESNSSMFIGRYLGSTVSLSGAVKVYGVCGGSGSFPTSEELVAQYEAIKAAGDIVGIPGKTHHLYSIKTDAVNSGSVPGIISDQVGTSSLSKVGSPVLIQDLGPNIRSS
jgi:hypothetical protein